MINYTNMLSVMLTPATFGIEEAFVTHKNSNETDLMSCANGLSFKVCNTMERQKVRKKEADYASKIIR